MIQEATKTQKQKIRIIIALIFILGLVVVLYLYKRSKIQDKVIIKEQKVSNNNVGESKINVENIALNNKLKIKTTKHNIVKYIIKTAGVVQYAITVTHGAEYREIKSIITNTTYTDYHITCTRDKKTYDTILRFSDTEYVITFDDSEQLLQSPELLIKHPYCSRYYNNIKDNQLQLSLCPLVEISSIEYINSPKPDKQVEQNISKKDISKQKIFEYIIGLKNRNKENLATQNNIEIPIKASGYTDSDKISDLEVTNLENGHHLYSFAFVGADSEFKITYTNEEYMIFENNTKKMFIKFTSPLAIKSISHWPIADHISTNQKNIPITEPQSSTTTQVN